MKYDQEFVKGKHQIGWVDYIITRHFKGSSFEDKIAPTSQTILRPMSDAEIESELKPGLCELGDILAFLDNAPEECKDGRANLFYFSAFVVGVYWHGGGWYVDAWRRGAYRWDDDGRVFSPATGTSAPLASSDTLNLESFDARLKKLEAIFNSNLLK